MTVNENTGEKGLPGEKTDEKEIQQALFQEVKAINRTLPVYKAIRGVVVSKEPLIKTATNKVKRLEEMKTL